MCRTRAQKLVALQQYMDLESGKIDESSFVAENALYEKSLRKKSLDTKILKCDKCPGLNITRFTECCCGWGNLNASIFLVGQSLHKYGVQSGVPFIMASGFLLDAALRLSSITRYDIFLSNCLHCHPPGNRPSTPKEKRNCLPYLQEELSIVEPKLIVALGEDAKQALLTLGIKSNKKENVKVLSTVHPAKFMYAEPESRVNWVLKLSIEMDKAQKER